MVNLSTKLGLEIKIIERGELSEFHALFVRIALHKDSLDTERLMDAIHWLFNMSGYGLGEETDLCYRHAVSMLKNYNQYGDSDPASQLACGLLYKWAAFKKRLKSMVFGPSANT